MYTSLEADKGEEVGFLNRYKKPLVFLASIIAIVGIVLILVFVLLDRTGDGSGGGNIEKYPFTLDSIFNSSLNPKSFNLRWDADNLSYIYQEPATKDYYRHNIVSGISSLLVNVTDLAEKVPNYSGLSFSQDSSLLLVSYNVSSVWRHSFLASYKIYDVTTLQVTSIADGNQLQNVQWNPANHQIAYVYENNIYIINADNVASPAIIVTTDGNAEDGILNGIQSWVYEEEIFSDFRALWWSSNGNFLSYLRFDESDVPIFYYSLYTDSAYPTEASLRYPKAGYPNPKVELKVFDVSNSSSSLPSLSFGADQTWEYISSVQWNQNALWVQTLNRYQNYSSFIVFSLSNGVWSSSVPHVTTSPKWIDTYPIIFCNGYNLTILPNGDNLHIANLASPVTFLTTGPFDVISIAGCSADGKAFFHATPVIDPIDPVASTLQYLFFLDTNNNNGITQVNKESGVFSASSFSPFGNYFVVNYQGPNIPKVFLLSTDLSVNITLEDNSAYAENIRHYDFPEKVYTVVTGANGDKLNAYYKKPVNVDKKAPLIIDVYAGPGTQKVQQIHRVGGLDAWLASQGYVVAAIDGRGTGRRGLSFLQATYRQLGLVELADQRAGTKDLVSNQLKKIVDSDRVAIWGWSFGGFMAANAIAGTSQLTEPFNFKAAVSVAPVVDWRFYDSVYTERYMSTPADNVAGYDATSVLKHAANTPNNKLLLMHGTGDDNVHFQNTVELANVLIHSNVQFETMFYPNDDHSISSGNAKKYLYEKLTNFLKQEL